MDIFYQIHQLYKKNNYDGGKVLLDTIDITTLKGQQIKSYNSLLLKYFIETKDDHMINDIIDSIDLMKRDYLAYCLYMGDTEKSINVFNIRVKNKEQILEKDISFLIKNKMTFLLKELDGYYIKSKSKGENIYDELKRYNIDFIKEHILNYYSELIPQKTLTLLNNNKNYDVIIDGGNVCFFGTKYKYVLRLMNLIKKQYVNPLIILHTRHTKTKNKNMEIFLQKYKTNIILTPYNVYDDYCIIYSMIKYNLPVITNDKFKDHIFEMYKLFDTKNNTIANYLADMCLTYDLKHIKNYNSYSMCIQCINDSIYIPCTDNKFIKIKIDRN